MPSNINVADRERLVRVEGIGDVLAERILTERERVGGFSTIDELGAIAGVTEERLIALRKAFVTTDAPRRVSTKISVVCTPSATATITSYAGHSVVVTATRRSTDDLPERPVAASTPVGADGRGEVELPPREDLTATVVAKVLAPDGEVRGTTEILAAKLSDEIEIKADPQVPVVTAANDDPSFGRPTRLKGRVIDGAGKRQIANSQVVIWAATKTGPSAKDFVALVVAETDRLGHFAGPYPVGTFTEANATVALGDGTQTVTVHLGSAPTAGEFPEQVILVVDAPAVLDEHADEEDCGCDVRTVAPRDPDARDLGRADGTFSSDAGAGRCVDFTTPDRTLEEFTYTYVIRTTEPAIKGLTLTEPSRVDPKKIFDILGSTMVQKPSAGLAASSMMMRTASLVGVVDGEGTDDAPTVSRSVDASITQLSGLKLDATILKRAAQDPDGFGLATLIDADQLSRHVELGRYLRDVLRPKPGRAPLGCSNAVDWDDDPTIYQACTIAHGHVLRFKQEYIADGYSMGNLLYSLPLAPGQKKQIAVVDWERREANARTERLDESEALTADLLRDRDISDIVNATLTETTRGGSSSSSSSFAGGLGIGAIVGPVGGLLGIGGGSSSAGTKAWQNSARDTSASALNQLRDRTTQSASAVRSQRSSTVQTVSQGERVTATTEVVANYNHCHAITIQYFEVLRHLLVRQRLTDVQECLFVPLLMSRFDSAKTLRWRSSLANATPRVLRGGFASLERRANSYAGSDFPIARYADEQLATIEGDLTLRFELARPKDKDDDFDAPAWLWIGRLLPGINANEFYRTFLKDQAFKDRVFREQLGPQIAGNIAQHLRISALTSNGETPLPVDTTLLSRYSDGGPMAVTIRMRGDLPAMRRSDIKAIKISAKLGLPGSPFLSSTIPANSRVIVEGGNLRYTTKNSSDRLFASSRILNDLSGTDDVRIETPLNRNELRNPRQEDIESSRLLLAHLNEHIERFHHVIWSRMSSDRRFMLLDGFEAPNASGRSVASVVENELIGIVGNCLVMPVAPGFHLDPTYDQDTQNPVDLLEHYEPNTPIEPNRLAVPTRGVYAEAVMGACNSCERKEEERFWRWEESPLPDSPAAILPISTDSRRAVPPDMTAKDFPNSIIAMQAVPAAPDPTGLGAALQLLGQSDTFRDITGIEGTQRNAAAALEGAFSTATTFGTKAADLALQGKMAKDIDKAMRTIESAKAQGLINDSQAAQLTETAIRGMVGAGTTNAPSATTPNEVRELTETAGQQGAAVALTRPSGERVAVDARPVPAGTGGSGAGGPGPGAPSIGSFLEDLFGGDPKPQSSNAGPPNPTTDKPKALAKIQAFRMSTGGSAWHSSLKRDRVADTLTSLVNTPDQLDQGMFGFCGPAVFFNTWFRRDPVKASDFAMALYNSGQAYIGSKLVETGHFLHGDDIRSTDYAKVAAKVVAQGRSMLPEAEWMMMGAYQDATNSWWTGDFEGNPDEEDYLGISVDDTVSWLKATRMFSAVKNETTTGPRTIAHATSLVPAAGREIMLLITAHLISAPNKKTPGSNHYVLLRKPFVEDPANPGTYEYTVWTWGGLRTVRSTKADIETMYFGAIICEQ